MVNVGVSTLRARGADVPVLAQHFPLHAQVYDAHTGCRDGIHADLMNENQGAESALSFLTALTEMRDAPPAREPHHEELWGIEAPRITWVAELEKYVVAYTAFSRNGPGVARALTDDFHTVERCGLVMQPDDKDDALLPRRIDDNCALIHRPLSDHAAHIWISFSPDLRSWGKHKPMLLARKGRR